MMQDEVRARAAKRTARRSPRVEINPWVPLMLNLKQSWPGLEKQQGNPI
jgi:hypothetical protein